MEELELNLKLRASMEANKLFSGPWLLLAALAMVYHVSATDHIVGGNRGWNPNINYTDWVNSETFVLLDWISFRYQKDQHNVVQVNQSGYDNCTTDNAIGNWSSGKDFFFLNVSKRYYYIDGRGGCYGGMKITFFVENPAPPPHHSVSENATTKANGGSDPGCELRPVGLTVSALLMLAGALFGL